MNRSSFLQQSHSSNITNSRYVIVEPRAFHEANNCAQGNGGISIGEGAYGVVYKALDTLTSKYVALKKMKIDSETDGLSSSTVRETTLLMRLNHENVVKLEDAVFERDRMCLIFELLELDLRKYLDNFPDALPEQTVRSFSAQLMSGLAYCHSMGIMHRDLKPQNILVSSKLQLKIADFGLARTFTPFARPLTIDVITRWYRAPEIILGQSRYNCGVDVWSVGCIIAEMSNKHPLFIADNEYHLLTKIFRKLGTPSNAVWPDVEELPHYQPLFPQWPPQAMSYWLPNISPEGLNLMEKIFTYDPRRRISAKDSLRHPYLRPYVAEKDLFDPIQLSLMQTPVAQHRSMGMPGNGGHLSAAASAQVVPAYIGSVSTSNTTQHRHVNDQGGISTTAAVPAPALPVFLNKVTPENNTNNLLISDNQQEGNPNQLPLQEPSAQEQIDSTDVARRCDGDHASDHPEQHVATSASSLRLPLTSSTNADSEVASYDPAASRAKSSGKYFLPIDQPNLDYDDDELDSDQGEFPQRSSKMVVSVENKTVARKGRAGQLKADTSEGQNESVGIISQQNVKGKEFLGPIVSVLPKTVVARSATAVPAAPFPSLPGASISSAAPVSSASMFQPTSASTIVSSTVVGNNPSVVIADATVVVDGIASRPEGATRGRKRKVLDAMNSDALPLDSSLATKKLSVEDMNVSTLTSASAGTRRSSASKKKNAVSAEDTIQMPAIQLESEFVGEEGQSTSHNDDNDDDKNLLTCIAESIARKKLTKVQTSREKSGKLAKEVQEVQPTRRSTRNK